MRLVYLSPVPFASFAQRPHKFVDWFHRNTNGEVLWVEPYPTRLLTIRDLPRIFKDNKNSEIFNSPFWLKRIQPYALPIEPLSHLNFINQFLWGGVIDMISDFTCAQKAMIVIGKPSAMALDILMKLKGFPSLYDAMDLFSAFYKGISQRSMVKMELEIAKRVDTVWASSTDLGSYWKDECKKVQIVKNGFDSSMSIPNRTANQNINGKIFGYVGTVSAWFDWDLVIQLAKERKGDLIKIVGPISKYPNGTLPSNIELLPACNHETAMNLMSKFDVGLIPFLKTKLTDYVDPIKYYEYRAFGIPVLSTIFGEMPYKSKDLGVFLLTGHQDINLMAEAAIKFSGNPQKYNQNTELYSWDSRFNNSGILK
jgi:glycosyltransferase involved in cell wall biosynthesis